MSACIVSNGECALFSVAGKLISWLRPVYLTGFFRNKKILSKNNLGGCVIFT